MTNHVHFIAIPSDTDGLALMFREAHRRYTRKINEREGWTGHLWQDRYASFIMNEPHAVMAARYIENNPVHAGLTARAQHYPWSSAGFHLGTVKTDILVRNDHPLPHLIADWAAYLAEDINNPDQFFKTGALLKKYEKSGKPLILPATGTE
jgi:putative transposase